MIDYFYLYKKYKDSDIEIVNEINTDGTIKKYTYKYILSEAERISKLLSEQGIDEKDNCILYLDNGAKFLIYFLALFKLNANIILLDTKASEEELNYLLAKVKARSIFYNTNSEVNFNKKFNLTFNVDTEEIIVNSKIDKYKEQEKTQAKCIIFSSGTTSKKSGIIHEITNMYELIKYTNYRYKVKENESFLTIVPNTHIYGLAVNVIFSTYVGTKVYFLKDLNFNILLKVLKENKIDYFCGVAKLYEMFEMVIKSKMKKIHIKLAKGCFKIRCLLGLNIGKLIFRDVFKTFGNMCLMNAGSSLSEETTKFMFGVGFPIIKFYGLTETGVPIICTEDKNKYTYGEGKLLEPSIVKINDKTNELYVKSDYILKGYINDEDHKLLDNLMIGDWVNTGDIAVYKNNSFYITGRTKDTIILSNGEKVSPDDIELFYKDLNKMVDDYAICGIRKDKEISDEIHIFVVKKNKYTDEDIKKCIANIAKEVSNNMRINVKNIHIVDKIPRTSIGKAMRYKLKQEIKEEDIL